MLDRSADYLAAITAAGRRIRVRANVSIIDPDIVYQTPASSGAAAWSKPAQLYDRTMELDSRYATLERGRWLLDGTFRLIPEDPAQLDGETGFVGDTISGDDGTFSPAAWVEERFSGVDVLQACSVYFSTEDFDGIPVDFTVEVLQGGTAYYTKEFTGNTATFVSMDGFTVYNPDAIRVTVTKWSLPGRRLRVAEIVPGVYESWDLRMIADVSIVQQGDVSCMALPYGTCTLKLDNTTKRFEPRKKASLFKSIEERQGIGFEIGVRLPGGGIEWKPTCVFYQKGDGWKTSANEPTIVWDLVDIIGLVTDRTFIPPATLPTTLSGWVTAIVSELGTNFEGCYHVDPDYADLPVTANSVEEVTGKKCGDILRWACQATGTWPRAASDTGYLTVEPLWSQGNQVTLRSILNYPTMKANGDIAMLIFKLHDGNDTQYIVSGTSASAADSKTIDNPFLHTQAQALAAARLILATYGGNRMETTGRGDPSSEIGDVDTVWLDESSATTGRRIMQTFAIQDGVLQNCQSVFLQADGGFLFQDCAIITESGTWKAPAGVSKLRVVIGQGGQGGMKGQDGSLTKGNKPHMNADTGEVSQNGTYNSDYGADGESGVGGKIWYGTIDINPEQEFVVHIGKGGAPSQTYGVPGAMGEETTFGAYSSDNGKVYPMGYTDIANGDSYGRSGVPVPKNGTSDGAAGGKGGTPGVGGWGKASLIIEGSGQKIYYSYWKPVKQPGPGGTAQKGADGFVLVFWDKEAAS